MPGSASRLPRDRCSSLWHRRDTKRARHRRGAQILPWWPRWRVQSRRLSLDVMADFEPAGDRSSFSIPVPRWLEAGGAWGFRFLALSVALYCIVHAILFLHAAVLPVLLGLILTTLFSPLAHLLRRWKLPRPLSAALSILIGLAALGGAITAVGFAMSGEFQPLSSSLERGYRALVGWSADQAGVPRAEVTEWVDSHLSNLRSSAGSYVRAAFSQMKGVLSVATILLLAIVFSWFFTWDGDRQFDWLVRVLPHKQRGHAREIGRRIWETVGSYMRGMFIIATADALLLGLGLLIIGMPLILPLMVLMFLGALVPFLGPFIAGSSATLIGLADGGLSQAALVLLVTFAVQQIEGNFLQPFIMGRAVKLHPSVVLFSVTAGAVIAGVAGIFFAVPIAASLFITLRYFREQGYV